MCSHACSRSHAALWCIHIICESLQSPLFAFFCQVSSPRGTIGTLGCGGYVRSMGEKRHNVRKLNRVRVFTSSLSLSTYIYIYVCVFISFSFLSSLHWIIWKMSFYFGTYRELLAVHSPRLHAHLTRLDIRHDVYLTEWWGGGGRYCLLPIARLSNLIYTHKQYVFVYICVFIYLFT